MSRWTIAVAVSVVLALSIVGARMLLLAHLRSEFAKLGLPFPPHGFDVELSPQLFRVVVWFNLISQFYLALIVVFALLPLAVAAIWPSSTSHEIKTETQGRQ